MNMKKLIMVCLAVTALVAALELSNLLPPLAAAVLFLGAGCIVAYLLALGEQRRNSINELNFISQAEHSLTNCPPRLVLNRLQEAIKKGTGADKVYFSAQLPSAEAGVNDEWDEQMITTVDALVRERQAAFIWPNPDDSQLAALFDLSEVKELMALPVKNGDELMGVLYVGSDSPIRLDQKQDMVGRLTLCAANAIIRHRLYETEKAHATAIIKALINAIDTQQPFFAGHSERVAAAAILIAGRLNLTPEESQAIKYSALLHDAGKIRAGDGEQEKAGREHPLQGAALLPEDEFFTPIKEAILSHHERYDGQGYPQGLVRNDIPFLARIIAVADVYDALVRLCPEEERLNHARAVQTIKKATGTLFDPLVVVAFEEVAAEINAFYQNN